MKFGKCLSNPIYMQLSTIAVDVIGQIIQRDDDHSRLTVGIYLRLVHKEKEKTLVKEVDSC